MQKRQAFWVAFFLKALLERKVKLHGMVNRPDSTRTKHRPVLNELCCFGKRKDLGHDISPFVPLWFFMGIQLW
jgi:hypothetical protein